MQVCKIVGIHKITCSQANLPGYKRSLAVRQICREKQDLLQSGKLFGIHNISNSQANLQGYIGSLAVRQTSRGYTISCSQANLQEDTRSFAVRQTCRDTKNLLQSGKLVGTHKISCCQANLLVYTSSLGAIQDLLQSGKLAVTHKITCS